MTSNAPQTLAWEPLDSRHILACQRVAVPGLLHILPDKYVQNFQNHPKPCCKNPHNLEAEAWYSSPAEQAKGVPDLYKFHCSCGACHVRFCVGGDHPADPAKKDIRPFWEVR